MKKQIGDYELRVKKLNNDRFEWQMTKNKCEEDLKILLEDYFQRGNLLEASEAKAEKYKERVSQEKKNFNTLKVQYKTLEKKYEDTVCEKRAENAGMVDRVKLLELENEKLRKSLSESDAKYEKLLLAGQQNETEKSSCVDTQNAQPEKSLKLTPTDHNKTEDKEHIRPVTVDPQNVLANKDIIEKVKLSKGNLDDQTSVKSSNLKRKLNSLNVTKKSVTFNTEVDLQYFDGENPPITKNKEYIDILKPPQDNQPSSSQSSNIPSKPVRKVYKNIPEYHPIKPTPRRLPKLQAIPQKPFPVPHQTIQNKISATDIFGCKHLTTTTPQDKITASDIFDIFPTSPKQTLEDIDDSPMFDSDNLDEAMDFLLNM